ncbi:MAG TPA: PHB depolymerase family esterase [Terrimesophilobacter sp.]|nr:PHB depolymerase family esterase [Terrimesophilobacter sp.]HRP98886.1 PHB depolymerase family esterase [Terrimesophilobacter sp.]
MAERPQHPEEYYYSGPTPFFASRQNPRFSYCLYVPQSHGAAERPLPLVVLQHGTGRRAANYRDAFADFAEEQSVLVLAPLFPASLTDPSELHSFKFIRSSTTRFDEALLDIVQEIGERFAVNTERFYLHGFSGGGQFTHRFFYLHPDRLAGVSIGAPGRITPIDPDADWWLGVRDFQERFGTDIDLASLRTVPVQMVVGADDTETWEINNPGSSNWRDGVEATGATRVERLRTLQQNYLKHGISVRFDLVEGVGHDALSVLEPVRDFFAEYINNQQ